MYLEMSTAYIASQSRFENRLQARALADGAIDIGYRQLIDNPSFRGSLPAVSDTYGSYQITISSAGSDVEILCQRNCG